MADRDIFDLELSPGEQPRSGIGDRVLAGIAGLALLAGLAIAVMNAVPHDETAQASPTPSVAPSRTAVPFPTQAPPRVVSVASPDIEMAPPSQEAQFSGWIRASVDLVIHSIPEPDGPRVGVLAKGAIAYANQADQPAGDPGWLLVQSPQGWIASISAGASLVKRYEPATYLNSGWVSTIAAGPSGFLATGSPPSPSNSYGPPKLIVSGDGATWVATTSNPFAGYGGPNAWGPAGWLSVEYVSDENGNSRIWIWRSTDGRSWTRLGMLAGLTSDYPNQFVASDGAYLLQTSPQNGDQRESFWSSADGQTWTESVDTVLTTSANGDRQVKGLADGFYIWDTGAPQVPSLRPFAAFSVDGKTWRKVVGGPDGANLQITTHAGRILGIDVERASLETRVWTASIVRGSLLWTRRPDEDGAFAGAVVAQLVTDGTRAYAFGWQRSTDQPLVWSLDGDRWSRAELPDSFGGIPTMAAAWRGGVVAVGHRPTLRGDNPIFWHLTPGGGWMPEANPVMAFVSNPTADQCAPLPTDFVSFTIADTAAAIACHGAAPISFRAWSVACEGCGGYDSGSAQPAWLLQPSTNLLYLSPAKDEGGGWWNSIVLSPTLKIDPSWRSAWIAVTGHYDDPAAATCHQQPGADDLAWWQGQQGLVTQCRQTFVVTDVKVVDGP